MAWPLSNLNQKITNNIPFLKLFPQKAQTSPRGIFLFFYFFFSTLEQKIITKFKKCPLGWSEPFKKKSFKKGILFVIFWFYLLRGHATFFYNFSYLSPVWAPVGKSPLCFGGRFLKKFMKLKIHVFLHISLPIISIV